MTQKIIEGNPIDSTDPLDTLDSLAAPASHAAAVTPSNDTPLTTQARALYIGGAGDVALKLTDDDTAVTFKAVPVGTVLPVRAKYVMSTNTTATLIVALW